MYTVTVTAVNRAGNSSSVEGGIHFQGKLELPPICTTWMTVPVPLITRIHLLLQYQVHQQRLPSPQCLGQSCLSRGQPQTNLPMHPQ